LVFSDRFKPPGSEEEEGEQLKLVREGMQTKFRWKREKSSKETQKGTERKGVPKSSGILMLSFEGEVYKKKRGEKKEKVFQETIREVAFLSISRSKCQLESGGGVPKSTKNNWGKKCRKGDCVKSI